MFNGIGHIGDSVVLGWVVLQMTDSPFFVAIALGLRSLPSIFLGPLGGVIADVVDRRMLIRSLGLGMAAVSGTMALLIFLDVVQVWHLFLLTLLNGVLGSPQQTAGQSLVFDIVGRRSVVNGLAFVSLGMSVGGIVGSLAVGFNMDQAGADAAYLFIMISYILSAIFAVLIKSPGQAAPATRLPVVQTLIEFGSHVRRNNMLLTLVVLTGLVEIMGFSHQAILPSLTRDVLNKGADGLGILSAFRSASGILVVILVAAMGEKQRNGLAYLVVLLVFGVSMVALGFVSSFVLAVVVTSVISGMARLSDIYSQGILQIIVPNELRGSAMGAWVLATGTAPVGNLQMGALAATVGIAFALTANGIGLIALAVLAFLLLPKLRSL